MAELQSWEGSITRWYEKNLGLRGGYSRRIHRGLPSSIENSEYVTELPYGLRIVARSGMRLPSPIQTEAHYSHPYGNPKLVSDNRRKMIKQNYKRR